LKSKINSSIRRKLALLFIGLMFLTLLAIGVLNTFFLEPYYISRKSDTLTLIYDKLNRADSYEEIVNDDFERLLLERNVSDMIVVNEQVETKVASGRQEESNLKGILFGRLTGMLSEKSDILVQSDDYILQKITDRNSNSDYLEMWGQLDNGDYFLLRTPAAAIQESVQVSNMFFVYIGLIMIFVSGIIMLFFSNKITKPISELTSLSKRMADLDFDAAYVSGGSDEIGVLGENFNKMSNKLQRAITELKTANNELLKDIEQKVQIDEMRKEFLSNVSHELKTPIALIQGYSEGLKECINEDAESRDFYCDVIMDESAKMNKMVQNLLSLNQIEFGNDQVAMERFDMTALIQGVANATSILAEQKEVEIIFRETEPVFVWGDEFKIEEVLNNYVSNALHHVKYKKIIEIRIHRREEKVRICVFNTGDPIPEEDIENIWIKFYKVDKARTREYGGSGIGLSIVKAIMDSMNQKCGVINYENGVEFWFELESK